MCDGSVRTMDSLFSIIFVLLASHIHLIATADRKFGCLFEDELCTPYEICVNDGVFGRCQRVPVTDVYTYEVSPAALLRLRTLLQKLSLRGLSWRDDTTQQAVSKELSKLRKVSHRRPETSPADTGSSPRKLKPVEVELSRSLKKYLQDLNVLPRPAAPPSPKPKGQKSLSKSPYQDTPPPAKAFVPLPAMGPPPAGEPSAPALSSRLPDRAKMTKLLADLEQYLGMKAPALGKPQLPAVGRLPMKTQSLLAYKSRWRPIVGTKAENTGPKSDLDVFTGRVPFQAVPAAAKPQRPIPDRLFLKAGSNQAMRKDPLSAMDESFIQNVVTQLGRHRVNMDTLSPKELDQLGDVIADVLQVVDEGGARGDQRDVKREPAASAALAQGMEPPEDAPPQEQQIEEGKPDTDDKDTVFLSKLLEYLDSSPPSAAPGSNAQQGEGQPGAAASAKAPGGSTARGTEAGMENVRSRITQAQVAVEKKEAAAVDSAELLEVERWIHGPAPVAMAAVLDDPHGKDMHMQENEMDVQPVSAIDRQNDFGYIITDSDSLSTDEGLHLMELLARHVKLHMTDFLDLSVQGPAVTFKVQPNPQNVSTADVASAAAQHKDQLEKETGVRILEAGVNDVSGRKSSFFFLF
ncbi:hypothetical protein AGOR_G00176350 [Albula goreensis]|uniref:Protein-tyrosine phosphatase receptor IA-2 ectodomain domain-containing protein n=1 Tax=Albula goreensis TaxID=1534307 RepID=A0A8T3CV87_9TELE|nr:hypothetical protein AGOR_G00176350 [Albula goreensis]